MRPHGWQAFLRRLRYPRDVLTVGANIAYLGGHELATTRVLLQLTWLGFALGAAIVEVSGASPS